MKKLFLFSIILLVVIILDLIFMIIGWYSTNGLLWGHLLNEFRDYFLSDIGQKQIWVRLALVVTNFAILIWIYKTKELNKSQFWILFLINLSYFPVISILIDVLYAMLISVIMGYDPNLRPGVLINVYIHEIVGVIAILLIVWQRNKSLRLK